MTPEAQRIAIEKTIGDKWWVAKYPGGPLLRPDYLNDLNAMHEAEKARWTGDLKRLHNDAKTYTEWKRYQALLSYDIHATAAQRAEAFLTTIGEWLD